MQRLNKKLRTKFGPEVEFLKGALLKPKTIGAIAPSSSFTAKRMAAAIDLSIKLPVLEFGPGSGVITKAILSHGLEASQLYSIEFSKHFLPSLRRQYKGVNFIHADAFEIDEITQLKEIKQFNTIISGLPLLNFPKQARESLITKLVSRLPEGRPMVQFSYGLKPPINTVRGKFRVEHLHTEIRNLPPARIWEYYRD